MEIHLKIVGFLLIGLSLMHAVIPRYFHWGQELKPLSLITRQIVYVHTFFIALVVFLNGLLCLFYADKLMNDPFGRIISLALSGFWFVRLMFQFFVYSPKVWRGRKFETAMHIVFSITWIYFTCVFFGCGLHNL